jgi:signal transduction histidine kinase
MRLRPRSVTLLAALIAGVLTDLVIMVPTLHFAYRSVPLHAMLEATASLIGFLTTMLLWGRLRQRQMLGDLLLFIAVGVLALTNLLFAAIPAAIWREPHPFSTWTTLASAALAAGLLAASAFVRDRRLGNYERAARLAVICIGVSLVLIGVVIGAFVSKLPLGIDPSRSPVDIPGPIAGNIVVAVTQLLIAALFVVASLGFTQLAERSRDEFLLWLGAACAISAFARVNYFIFPSLYSEWVYTGDALRLTSYVLLFVGAAREIDIYQRAYAESRVLEERRRIARDLHDGLAQELAFMVTTTRKLVDARYGDRELIKLASAAERGLDESRRAIASLTQRNNQPFDVALVQTVEEVGDRLGAQVFVTADAAPRLTQERQEQLLRIVREAVTNAVRHGSANVVRVEFSNGHGLHLRIEDDGVGFDPAGVHPNGFGLIGMRERAAALGGQLFIASTADGTQIEVILP